uniref:Collagen type XII alpha 1 chain n=1 Tax=Gadus morhua TaxID=8049 RepID=A0A8C5CCN3_GADMO
MFPERLEIIVLSLLLCIPLQRPSLWARQCLVWLTWWTCSLPVDPPSELKFKILNENTVQMTWVSPFAYIDGYRIQVTSDTEELDKQLELPASATKTSITELIPDVDYTVIISSYEGARESLPLTGGGGGGGAGGGGNPKRPVVFGSYNKCSVSAVADVVFVVDGSGSVGQENFKHLRSVMVTVAGAFEIGADKTRVAVVQYSDEVGPQFPLRQHLSRGELVRAINAMPFKGGKAMTGAALDYVLEHSFSEAGGARPGFPKVAVVIGASKSQDSVEVQARRLRGAGVEVFVLGIKEADAEEMTLMASTPHSTHVYSVLDFEQIKRVHKALVTQVCAGVDDQLSSLVSGEEVVEPANNLQVLEFASKSMRLTWDPSFGDVSGYKIQVVPMMSGPKRQELYVGHAQTSLLVRDLAPDTEYQISLFALNGLTPSEAVTVMGKTESVQVSLECSLGVDVQADVVLLVDGSYSIGLANFAKVRAFLEVLVKSFDIGPGKVQISLVQYSRDPHTEFHLNTHHDLDRVVAAVRSFPYRGGSTNTGRAMTYVRQKIFLPTRGARASVPRITILITDGKSSDAFKEPATLLRSADVEIFAVGVKEAVRSELVAIANTPADTHVYTVDDFDAFQRISKELTQSICLRIEQELRNIQKRKLLPPRSLTFSEVGSRSFRASWATDTPSVQSYLVQFRPADDTDGHFVSVSVPGDTLTSLLPHLSPATRYEVHVLAQYDQGDSFPVSEYETTLEEQGPVRGLRVSEETMDSFRVSWLPAPGAVLRYRLSYEPTRGDNARLETTVPRGGETTSVLQRLLPRTTYRVTVTPEYAAGDGPEGQTQGTTKEARGSPRDLRVSDETATTMRLGWAPAPGSVAQYRVSFRPLAGGPRKEVSVKGENTGLVLKNLQPGTQYELSVRARYRAGLGDPLEGSGTTLPELTPPRDLVTDDVTPTSFSASWTPAPGPVQEYRVLWKSLVSQEAGEKTVPGDQSRIPLEELTPETLYQVSVVAVYPHGQSPALLGQETTDASAAGKALVVTEETESTMRVTWTPAPGKVSHYRLRHVSQGLGGREVALKIPGSLSSTVMKRLQPMTTYDIKVHPMYRHGEGKARQGVGTTLSPYKAPRNLQTSEPTKTSFRVSWDHAPGDVKGYKVTFHPIGDQVDLGVMLVGPHDNTIVLEELRAGTEYSVAVSGVFDNGVSLPLAGEEKTTLVEDSETPSLPPAVCKTTARADIILLVDGSWSIGRLNFKTIRSFISRMVGVFDIGPERVQIGVAQYSGDPKTMWHLNEHPTRDGLMKAVANLPYKGGNTMTGMALNFILKNNFQVNNGMRPEARKIGVLITDGKSQDEIIFSSKELRDQGIELYAVGVKNADVNELRSIASPPEVIHMYNVKDFSFLLDIVDDLSNNICNSVKGPGEEVDLGPPSDLVTSEATHYSFRASWTAPEGEVDAYRVLYQPTAGGPSLEVTVDQTSTVLVGLTPLTEYSVSVYAVRSEVNSEPLTGTETTLPLSAVRTMDVLDETTSTMRVRWEQAAGASGYRLLYRALNASQPSQELELRVGGDVTNVLLEELFSNTAYSISIFALHGGATSPPLDGVGVTRPELPAGVLRISDVTHSAMKLKWDAAPGNVRKYILTYKPDEGDAKEMEVNGDITSLDLGSLMSQSEYDVAVTPVYDQGPGTPMLGQAITDVVPAPKDLRTSEVTQTSFRVTWAVGAPDVAMYRLGWAKKGNPNYEHAILSNDDTTHVLEGLDIDTDYDVTVTAIYPDESESEDLIGHERTLSTGPPTDLVVINATTTSLTPKWGHAPGPVQNYKITYQPSAGGKTLTTQVGGKKTSAVLQKLSPDTPYTITVAAVYANGDSKDISGQGKTEPLGGVRNLQVLNPTMSTLNVRWEPASGKVKEYKVLYTPAAGGAERVEKVSSSATTTVLKGLQPDTIYTVTLVPVYAEGDGKRMSDDGKTKPLGGVKNLVVVNPTMSTLNVRWELAEGKVKEYKVLYTPAAGGAESMEQVSGTATSTVLRSLQPDTYAVSVQPVYPAREGRRQTENGMTLPLAGLSDLQVKNPSITTLTAEWTAADGNVQGYRVTYVPSNGGLEITVEVSESTTKMLLDKLLPDTQYTVTVVPVYAEGDGPSLTDNGKTKPLGFARNLQVTDPTTSTLNVRWDAAEGNVREYIVIWVPAVGGGEQEVDQVSGTTTSMVLKSLDPDTEYTVTVVPVYHEMEGKPQSKNGRTTPKGGVKNLKVVDPTLSTLTARWEPAPGNVRNYKVFYSVSPGGEPKLETVSGGTSSVVLRGLSSDTLYDVAVVPVYPDVDGVRQAETGKTKPLSGVKNLQVTDPTVSTLRVRWEPAEGDVRQYNVIYAPTAGGPDAMTQVSGMSTNTVLRGLTPETEYTVSVVPVYADLEGKRQSENGKTKPLGGVKDLTVTDPTTSSLRVRWEPAEGNVRHYRLFYVPDVGGAEDMEQVSGGTTNVVLRNLLSDMPYTVTVVPVYPEGEGLRQAEKGKTLPRTAPRNLQLYHPTPSSLNARWEPASGQVQQYRVTYTPLDGSKPLLTPGGTPTALLDGLLADTPYSVEVVPLYADGVGPGITADGKTREAPPPRREVIGHHRTGRVRKRGPYVVDTLFSARCRGDSGSGGARNLRVSDEWYTRFRVAWDPVATPVLGYKLVYAPTGRPQDSREVFVGDVTSYSPHNLQTGTTYDVKVFAQYGGGVSRALEGQGTTLYLNVTGLETEFIGHDKYCIKWTAHRAATNYRVMVAPVDSFNQGKQEITFPAGQPRYCFEGLSQDALYTATVFVQTPNLEGPGVSGKERTRESPVGTGGRTPPPVPARPQRAGADVVFLIDGSWSIGEDSFRKVIGFVSNLTGAFDVIGPSGIQVSFVQYSDSAKTEFRLNAYQDKGTVLSAYKLLPYRGGNTKTGVALSHTYEKAFSAANGMRRNVPKIVVTVTDGRSQDEVKKSAQQLQHAGYTVFVVGVADVDFSELQSIGSKPSERHIFVVDGFDDFENIRENLVTFICETATSSCPLIFLNGFTSPGFRMLEAFNLTEKTYSSIRGVSMEPGSFNSYTAYRLHKNAFLSQPSTEIHPDGLPHSYTILLTFRLLPDSPTEAFDIWQVSSKDHKPETGVTIDPTAQTVSFYNKDERGEIQRVVFDSAPIKSIFQRSFPEGNLHILVSSESVQLNLDCQEVAVKEVKAAGNTSSDGYQVLGKMSKSIGSKGQSATFQLQMFDIVCTLGWTSKDRCCDLPSRREEAKCPALPNACTCASDSSSTGEQGPIGPVIYRPVKQGERGSTSLSLNPPYLRKCSYLPQSGPTTTLGLWL